MAEILAAQLRITAVLLRKTGRSRRLFAVYGRVFTIMCVVMLCVSIIFQKRNNKIMQNILLNISTIGSLVLFVYLVQIKY